MNKKAKSVLLFTIITSIVMLAASAVVMAEGADRTKIKKSEAVCWSPGVDVDTNEPIISCYYGLRVDSTRVDVDGNEVTNTRTLAFEEIYLGGSFVDGKYQYDGNFVGKYKKDFFDNDNSEVFWKIEVGLNGTTLEYCNMRDQEYDSTSRTKESCESLYIDIM